MYEVSEKFLAAVRNPQQMKIVVDLYYANNNTPIKTNLPVVEGSVKFDDESRSRASGTVTVGDPDMFGTLTDDGGLDPYGCEITIRAGWVYADGSEEMVPLGKFMINSIEASDTEGLFPKIEFYDRAHRVYEMSTHVVDNEGPQAFGGEYTTTALQTTVQGAAPGYDDGQPFWGLTFVGLGEPDGLKDVKIPGGTYDGDTDRWEIAQQLARSMGGEIFFDRLGDCIVRVKPLVPENVSTEDAVWTIDCGETGVMINSTRKKSRENAYNSVVVVGAAANQQQDEKQPFAIVYDQNPASKLFYGGPFGKKTLRISENTLTTNDDCLIVASNKLKELGSLEKTVTIECLVNFALDPGDIIHVIYFDGSESLHMVKSYDFNFLDPGMTIETRTVSYAI